MPDIAQIRSERMAAIRAVRKQQRTLDTTVEAFERWLLRALQWKEKVPGQKDLERMIDYAEAIEYDLRGLEEAIGNAVRIFAII